MSTECKIVFTNEELLKLVEDEKIHTLSYHLSDWPIADGKILVYFEDKSTYNFKCIVNSVFEGIGGKWVHRLTSARNHDINVLYFYDLERDPLDPIFQIIGSRLGTYYNFMQAITERTDEILEIGMSIDIIKIYFPWLIHNKTKNSRK